MYPPNTPNGIAPGVPVAPQPAPAPYQPGVMPPPPPPVPQPGGLPQPGQFGNFDPNAHVPPAPPAPTIPINNPANLPPAPAPQPAPTPAPQPGLTWDQVYQDLSRQTGHPVEAYRQMINNNPAVLASIVGDAVGVINKVRNQPAPAPQPQPQPAVRQTGRVEIPDSVKPYLRETQNGIIEAAHPAYSEWAAIANNNMIQNREMVRRFTEDPTSLLKDPTVQEMIEKQVKQQFGQYSSQLERAQVRKTMRDKYIKDLAQHDANGQVIMNPMDPTKPLPTALGAATQAWCQRLIDQGMQETADLYETAIFRAKQELGMLNQPQYPQPPQQPGLFGAPVPPNPMMYGMPMPPNPYQAGPWQPPVGPPPFVPPAMGMLQQNQNNANTMWPGQPPARPNTVDPNMPFEQQLQILLATAPEGQGMDHYMKLLGM